MTSVELNRITVRPDWKTIAAREAIERARLASSFQLALAGAGVGVLAVSAWSGLPDVLFPIREVTFGAGFLLLAVCGAIFPLPRWTKSGAVVAGVLAGAIALALISAPPELRGPAFDFLPSLPAFSAVAVPAVTWLMLLWLQGRHPVQFPRFGLRRSRFASHAVIGAALGAALGLHFFVFVTSLPMTSSRVDSTLPALVWLASTGLGLRSLGEELALRGLLYHLLHPESGSSSWISWLRISAFGLPLYIVPWVSQVPAPVITLGLLYGLVFGLLSAFLRSTTRGLVAPLAANIAFNLCFTLVMLT